jgi:hypothetical protein
MREPSSLDDTSYALSALMSEPDMVNEPPHYRWLPMGIEAIDITELFNFNLGNALKYILRSKHKGREIEDLKKARWYIDREIKRMERDYL